MNRRLHYLILAAVLLLGLLVRFDQLAAKPLWLDEVITAVFSLGQTFLDVPLQGAIAGADLAQLFTLQPQTNCPQIVAAVTTQSVHPPLFFCWLHDWLTWVQRWPQSWVWQLRALPALAGVGAIAAVYWLNRVALSPLTGLLAAALMAVSPFAVYLSQEARHYTLPMVLMTLGLLGTFQIVQDLQTSQRRVAIWLGWVTVNGLGFYVHYFCLLAWLAQVGTILLCLLGPDHLAAQNGDRGWRLQLNRVRKNWRSLTLAIGSVLLLYAPWLPTFWSHINRPETDWMEPSGSPWLQWMAPLYQLPAGWVVMVVALPVEKQAAWVRIPSMVAMLLFFGWLVWLVARRLQVRWQFPAARALLQVLGLYIGLVLLAFMIIIYVLEKDLTLVPRYNFIYFPAVMAVLGVALTPDPHRAKSRERAQWAIAGIVLLVGLVSSWCVTHNLAFKKPYLPDQVAQVITAQGTVSPLVGLGYRDWQHVALGLSVALAVDAEAPAAPPPLFTFLSRSPSYATAWNQLAALELPPNAPWPRSLWVMAPGLRHRDYLPTLPLATATANAQCDLQPEQQLRIGVPYQGYRCAPVPSP